MQGNTYHIFFINNNDNGLQINVKIKCMRGSRERELTLSLLVSKQWLVLPCSIVSFSDNLHCPSLSPSIPLSYKAVSSCNFGLNEATFISLTKLKTISINIKEK